MEKPEHNFKIIINNDGNDKNNDDDVDNKNKNKISHLKSIEVKECANLLQPASLSI